MWGGFSFSKNLLIGLNLVYIMVAFLLIGVATYGKTSNMVTSLPIVGGIVASGVFLLFIAVAGLYGAYKHHQVTLFVYMVVLFLIFIIQFSVACACLAVDRRDELKLAEVAWKNVDNQIKLTCEQYFGCCGFDDKNKTGVDCDKVPACNDDKCPTCKDLIQDKIDYAFAASGGLGLFFSFTEIAGALIAWRYRNLVNPNQPTPSTMHGPQT